MKGIHFFYLGAGIDIFTVLVALYFVLGDLGSPSGGTNNPSMYTVIFAMLLLIAAAFGLKNAGHIGWANLLLWIPGFPLFCYGLMILAFIIFKPKF